MEPRAVAEKADGILVCLSGSRNRGIGESGLLGNEVNHIHAESVDSFI